MWCVWMLWAIAAINIIMTIILLMGKGSMRVSGFNTKSSEERAKYDKNKVSRQAGLSMVFIDIGSMFLTLYMYFRVLPAMQNGTVSAYGREISIVSLYICAYIMGIGILAVIRGFKNCRYGDADRD